MRNKFLKGLSVAFAAAMAFTVVAPALTTEAASTKAYVVSKAVDENGTVHTYTYDSRGRVIKEVATNTESTKKRYSGSNNKIDDGDTVVTTVEINGHHYSTTTVETSTYDNTLNLDEVDAKVTETTTYTYYNSGAKKDQVKTKKTVAEEQWIYNYVTTANDANYAYAEAYTSTTETAFNYNSKGQKISDVETLKGCGSYDILTGEADKNYYREVISKGDKANMWKITDNNIKSNHSKSQLNDFYIVETKTSYTYNSNNLVTKAEKTKTVGNHDETWDAESENKTADDVDIVSVSDGNYATFKYDKNGRPTKYVETKSNKLVITENGVTTTNDLADTVKTVAYTYGKDFHLSKKVVDEKNNLQFTAYVYWLSVVNRYLEENAFSFGGNSYPAGTFTSYDALLTAAEDLGYTEYQVISAISDEVGEYIDTNSDGRLTMADYTVYTGALPTGSIRTVVETGEDYKLSSETTVYANLQLNNVKSTYTYNNTIKEGALLKSAWTSTVKEETNGVSSNANYANDTKTFTLKKISIPSSREKAVFNAQFQLQNDYDF